MLSYLDALIAALAQRDATEADRLLAHPLARLLSEEVRDEARVFAAGECDSVAAPLRAMLLRRQTAELLREGPIVADRPETFAAPRDPRDPRESREPLEPAHDAPPTMAAGRRSRRGRPQQMELPLSA